MVFCLDLYAKVAEWLTRRSWDYNFLFLKESSKSQRKLKQENRFPPGSRGSNPLLGVYVNIFARRNRSILYRKFRDSRVEDETDPHNEYSYPPRNLDLILFSDETFFREYIRQVERICTDHYLDGFFSESNQELQNNLAIIYKEFPYNFLIINKVFL